MQAAEVLRLVSGALQDLEPGAESRWKWEGGDNGRIGLLDFLNDAVRVVVMQRPDAAVITEVIRLEAGMRQHLPSKRKHSATHDATMLIELIRNMGSDGETPGLSIVPTGTAVLLAWADPRKVSTTVDNFAYDKMTNKAVYYVYPAIPDSAEVWVEATYSITPRMVQSPSDKIGLPGEYAAAITHHVLASILSGDNESSNANKAAYHMQMFSSVLGVKLQVDSAWPKGRSSSVAGGAI